MKNISPHPSKPEYANWISRRLPLTLGVIAAVFALAAVLVLCLTPLFWLGAVLIAAALLFCALAVYMGCARSALSYSGGQVQSKVLDGVIGYLDTLHWNGSGKLLDIGCGSGAMSVKLAQKYPHAQITGMDYWGPGWEFSQKLCENNAQAEGVSQRVSFEQGDAAHLRYADATFDAAVSNFVFHEVRSQPDKHALILEALRVLKPGACFVFEDVFFAKSHYGDITSFIDALRPYVQEIHFVDMRRPAYAPAYLSTPFVLGQMGLIYGIK